MCERRRDGPRDDSGVQETSETSCRGACRALGFGRCALLPRCLGGLLRGCLVRRRLLPRRLLRRGRRRLRFLRQAVVRLVGGAAGERPLAADQRGDQLELLVEAALQLRSEEHTSELQSLTRISYACFCTTNKNSHIE